MWNRRMSRLAQAGALVGVLAAVVVHQAWSETETPARANGCDVLILWHTWRGRIDYSRSEVRVKSFPWVRLRGSKFPASISPPPPETRTNGRVWNWKEELRQERCDRDRRYRFMVVAPESTGVPVRSNEPYAGAERWLYVPSATGWTRKTNVDAGYLDLCVVDGTKCSKPYYPSGPTPILDW